jgi:hypothetical protein
MSKMKDVMIDLQDAIRKGDHSFADIARIYRVPRDWVDLALAEVLEQDRYDDSWLESRYDEQFETE